MASISIKNLIHYLLLILALQVVPGVSKADLSDEYPGDIGMLNDPDVIWMEDFERGSVSTVLNRYDSFVNQGESHMRLEEDTPALSSGSYSMAMTAGGGGSNQAATNIYKNFGSGFDEWYVRWYVKHQPNVWYQHTGVWFGGYNPPSPWPISGAGKVPAGNERFTIGAEAIKAGGLDFYTYWMRMHGRWGNLLVHNTSTDYGSEWYCVEVHFKVNPSLDSGEGAQLRLWINDQPIIAFTQTTGLGYWVADKFCPENADRPSCTDWPPDPGQEMIPLDLQVRNINDLRLNFLWVKNYTSGDQQTTVWYDDIVVATRRIGSIKSKTPKTPKTLKTPLNFRMLRLTQ